jgi:hypothetical protein
MTLEKQVMRLPKAEKLKLMEALWSDLSRNSEEFEPPQWHREALRRNRAIDC